MAAVTPIEYAPTVPIPQFTDGELLLSPQLEGVDSASPATFYLSRYMPLPAGKYTIKCDADDAVTMWVGNGSASMRKVYGSGLGDGVVSGEFVLFDDDKRIDFLLQNITPVPTLCWLCFSLRRDGILIYTSSAEGWLMDTAPIADGALLGDIAEPKFRMPVFSVLPNWNDGITEFLGFQTDVMGTEEGFESRRQVRQYPRRAFEASFLRKGTPRSRLDNFFTGVAAKRIMLPLWIEQFRTDTAITAGDTTSVTLPANFSKREFKADDFVFITGGDPEVFDLCVIDSIDGSGAITWSVAPTLDWPAGSRVIPARRARVLDQAELTNVTDDVGTVRARFELEPEAPPDPSWGLQPYLPLFKFKPDWATSPALAYSRVDFVFDNVSGEVDVYDPSDQAKTVQRIGMKLFGRDLVYSMRRFLAKAAGRAVRFYIPDFTNDVQPLEDVTDGTLLAAPTGFWQSMQIKQKARRWIGVVYHDGRPTIYHEVLNVEPVGLSDPPYRMTGERFYFVKPLPNIARADVLRITYMLPVRFDQDSFELHHYVNESAAVGISLATKVVDDTGMIPLDYVPRFVICAATACLPQPDAEAAYIEAYSEAHGGGWTIAEGYPTYDADGTPLKIKLERGGDTPPVLMFHPTFEINRDDVIDTPRPAATYTTIKPVGLTLVPAAGLNPAGMKLSGTHLVGNPEINYSADKFYNDFAPDGPWPIQSWEFTISDVEWWLDAVPHYTGNANTIFNLYNVYGQVRILLRVVGNVVHIGYITFLDETPVFYDLGPIATWGSVVNVLITVNSPLQTNIKIYFNGDLVAERDNSAAFHDCVLSGWGYTDAGESPMTSVSSWKCTNLKMYYGLHPEASIECSYVPCTV